MAANHQNSFDLLSTRSKEQYMALGSVALVTLESGVDVGTQNLVWKIGRGCKSSKIDCFFYLAVCDCR